MSRSIFRCRVKRVVSNIIVASFFLTTCLPQYAFAKKEVTVDELLGKETAKSSSIKSTSPQVKPDRSLSDATADASMVMASATAASFTGIVSETQSSINHFQFDPTSGTGIISLPIATPPGRRGLKPNIILTYSPRAGNGPYGVGWNIGFGMIERSTKNGTPSYNDDEDTFVAVIDGMSMELVKIDDGKYRAKVSGALYNFQYDGNYWLVRNGKGLTYYFGRDDLYRDESRQGPSGKTFRWKLSKVVDMLGNYYLIKYLTDGAFEVFWTGEPGTDSDGVNTPAQNFIARVETEIDTDSMWIDFISNCRGGWCEQIHAKIKAINVYALDQLQRKYVFDYEYSQRSGRSLLKQITEYGADGTTAMPSITFDYEESPIEYSLISQNNDPLVGDNLWNFRWNGGYDRSHDNYGKVPPYHMAPFGETVVASSWSEGGGSWTQDHYGRIDLYGRQDTGYYFYTYLYTQSPVNIPINISGNDCNPGYWINGDYSKSATSLNLKAGYNLVEYTDYNQHQSFHTYFTNTISDKVDLMNTVQLVLPQLSGDFNGDGLTDVATYFAEDGNIKVELSTGQAFLPKETWLQGIDEDSRILIGDINGDGRTDIMLFDSNNGAWSPKFSDGIKFTDEGVWLMDYGAEAGSRPLLAEINGDGKMDAIIIGQSGSETTLSVALNEGDRFSITNSELIDGDPEAFYPLDINGDGITDFAIFDHSEGKWTSYLNFNCKDINLFSAGLGFKFANFNSNSIPVIADINGDGKSDLGYYDSHEGKLFFRLSEGFYYDDLETQLPITFNLRGSDLQIQNGDFNGDGVIDFIAYNQVGNIEIAYSDGKISDLLTRIDNGIGGVTSIAYTPSIAYQNMYLPFVIPLVSAVTVSNSRGDDITTHYEYEGGLWRPEDREFYGFAKVRVYDQLGRYTETEFRQNDVYDRGKVNQTTTYDQNGYPLAKTENLEWITDEVFNGEDFSIKFAYPQKTYKLQYGIDGQDGIKLQSRSSYTILGPGILSYFPEIYFDGQADFNADYIIDEEGAGCEFPYFSNNTSDGAWLLAFPKYILRREKISFNNLFSDITYFFYDNSLALGEAPTIGLLTKKIIDDVNGEGNHQFFGYGYDSYGNLNSITDPREKTSSVIYDADFHVFPVVEINPLSQSVTKEYYGVEGVPLSGGGYSGLFGQLKSITDINGVTESYVYDTFGRLIKVVGPRDSLALPSVSYQYVINDDHMIKISSKRLDHGDARTVDAAEFFDGLGRTIQLKTNSGQDGKYIVAGQMDYDDAGRVQKEYLPHAATTALTTLDSIPAGLNYTFFEYDDQNRITKRINPDGTFASFDYDVIPNGGTYITTVIDENGHQKKSYIDIHGRVFKIEEYSGADGRSPYYPQQPFQLYATTRYEYGLRNQLEKVIDDHGNQTVIQYDGLGRKKSMDDPDMGYWQYGYDANSNMAWQIDAKNQRLDFSYDDLNRLINKTDGADIDVTYTYDINPEGYGGGRLGQVEYGKMYGNDLTRFFYDEFGRETQSLKVVDGIGYYVERDYDALGNLTEVQYPDGNSVYYHYDDAGRLDSIANDPVMFDDGEPLSKIEVQEGIWGVLKNFYNDWFEPYVLGVTSVYAQESSAAELISPSAGTVLNSVPLEFRWDPGYGATAHYLYIGTYWGGADIFAQLVTGKTSVTPENIYLTGGFIYVRLWSYLDGAWQYRDYKFQTEDLGLRPSEPELILPAEGAVLEGTSLEFQWDSNGMSPYYIYLGQDLGGADLGYAYILNMTNYTFSNIPLDGSPVYVRMYYRDGTVYKYVDYSFASIDNGLVFKPAEMISPAEEVVVDTTELTFQWDKGSGVTQYYLYLGSRAGGGDLFGRNMGTATSATVSTILLDGNPVYVRLWSRMGLRWEYRDYVYQTEDRGMAPDLAEMISPEPESILDQTTVNFQWSESDDASMYYLYVGTRVGGYDIYSGSQWMNTSREIEIPSDGNDIYVRLWSLINNSWKYNDYVYHTKAANVAPTLSMTAPSEILSGDKFQADIVVTDADQDPLSFVAQHIFFPEGAELTTVSNAAGQLEATLTWKPKRYDIGDHEVTLAVSDGKEEVFGNIVIHVARGPIVEDPKLYVSGIKYNVMGQIKKITYGTGTVSQYVYNDVTFRLERILTVNGEGVTIQDLNYHYDSVGNIISITDNVNTATQTFVYDHLNRLVEASAPSTYGTKTYEYDEIGNILEKDGLIYHYGESGDGPHAATSFDDGSAFGYDDNGNMISHSSSRGNFTYHFDAENRLASVDKNGNPLIEFRYDGDGGRTKKIAYGAASGISLGNMAYPELLQHGIGEDDMVTHFIGQLYEVDNLHEVKHIYMGSERILSVRDGQEQYIHADHLGSAHVVENRLGKIEQINEYQPFGEFSKQDRFWVIGQESDLYFTQQILDDETGLYYYGARYYDPALGRFISADSIVPSATNPQALNRYSYVYNSPICYTDPSGNFGFLAAAIVGAIIGGVSAGIQSDWNMEAVGWGALAGGLSGAMLSPATTASSLQITAFKNTSMFLVKGSAALSLGSQVAGAAGWSDGAQVMGQASQYMGLAFAGLHVATGIANWIHDPRYQTVRLDGSGAGIQSGDRVAVNGILTPLNETEGFGSNALGWAGNEGANVLAYNPTSSPIADLTEAVLEKLTFTGSVERQLIGDLKGLSGIQLAGFSQGGIIASNVSLGLGLTDQRNVLSQLTVGSTQVSQIRVALSGAVGGGLSSGKGTIVYGTGSMWDFSNALGPNISPKNFIGGCVGLAVTPFGISQHRWPY